VLALAGGIFYPKYQRKEIAKKRRWQLMTEFKDAMDSMVSALVAGYSMENAVSEAYKDLKLMYEKDTPMLWELKNLKQKIRLQQPLDKLFLEFGRRSGVEDILTFAQIYATARKSGGNLVKVMKRTADNIGEKMEIQREIQTMAAGKRMESLCMMVIPLLIILYMQFFSPGFLDPVYTGAAGRLFMSGALIVYILAVLWSRSIMNIRC
jgi:tight adherence protein B